MEKLPRALQLADWLDEVNAAPHPIHTKSAAAELRRLHEVNAELLAALKNILNEYQGLVDPDGKNTNGFEDYYEVEQARAAIAKATGEQP